MSRMRTVVMGGLTPARVATVTPTERKGESTTAAKTRGLVGGGSPAVEAKLHGIEGGLTPPRQAVAAARIVRQTAAHETNGASAGGRETAVPL